MPEARGGQLIPAAHDPRFARVFMWYARRLMARSFHGVHVEAASLPGVREAAADDAPLVLVMNHASWWDPLVALAAQHALFAGRPGIAPIDADQLRRFRFFRKLGLFGIVPDDPLSMDAMLDYVLGYLRATPRACFAVTPQGRFTDAREPLRIRPGAAGVCARLAPQVRCVCMSLEYAFWQSRRPEVFLRFDQVSPAHANSTPAWHRAIESAMQRSAEALARLVIARDPAPFTPLLASRGSSINPAYDLWLRMRGRAGEIAAARTQPNMSPRGGLHAAGEGGRP